MRRTRKGAGPMMSAMRLRLASGLAIALFAAMIGRAQQPPLTTPIVDQDSVTAAEDETTDLWFVELASAPTADGTGLGQVRQEKAAFRAAAAAARLQ